MLVFPILYISFLYELNEAKTNNLLIQRQPRLSITAGLRGGGSILPSNPNLPSKHCFQSKSASVGNVVGSVCNSTMRFRRLAWNGISPKSLDYRRALLTNEAGTSRISWEFMRVTHNSGWMATVILGQNYNFSYVNAPQLTNISYRCVCVDVLMIVR